MGSCRAISNNIAASASVFHVLGRIPRAARRALGPSALGHAVPPSGFDLEREKPRPRRAILQCSALTSLVSTFAHETREIAHETSFLLLLTKRVSRNEFFAPAHETSAHETSAHETSFFALLTKRVLTKRVQNS